MSNSYSQLQTDVLAWIARTDLTSLAPSFIRLAEAKIRRKLRIRTMETNNSAFTLSGSLATPLPTGWLEFKSVSLDVANARRLTPMTPAQLRQSGLIDSSGYPSAYAIEGTNILVAPASSDNLVITYYAAFDALSAAADTNWALDNAYDLYLWGAVAEGYGYLEDDVQQAKYDAKFDQIVDELNKEAQRSAWGTSPKSSGAPNTP